MAVGIGRANFCPPLHEKLRFAAYTPRIKVEINEDFYAGGFLGPFFCKKKKQILEKTKQLRKDGKKKHTRR